MKHFLIWFACILLATNVSAGDYVIESNSIIHSDGRRFVDDRGNTFIFSGLNYVNKNGYLSKNDEQLFKIFKKQGYNIIRFGIIWDRLEHNPGVIDEEYLQDIDKRVEWARQNGIYLMLDFHQDLYSSKWSDGAPAWATLDDQLPHVTGEIWSDSYYLSPAINRAFDNFWNNRPATDGIGVQDHYLNLLKIVAKRYAHASSVLGIDIFNEPYGGTASQEVPAKMFQSLLEVLPDSIKNSVKDFNSLRDNTTMINVLKALENNERYRIIMSNCAQLANQFEITKLSDFYQKARDVIRSVGNNKIIFLEHSYFCNLGIKSDFVMPKDKSGHTDRQCVYAPHGYDITTDTSIPSNDHFGRVDYLFDVIQQNGLSKKSPIMLGEWGAYYNSPASYNAANHIARIIEAKLFSQTYWSYDDNLYKTPYFNTAISRAYPRVINGVLVSYSNNPETRTFEMKWKEKGNGETIVYHPFISNLHVLLAPQSRYSIYRMSNSTAGYIVISGNKKGRIRTIKLSY